MSTLKKSIEGEASEVRAAHSVPAHPGQESPAQDRPAQDRPVQASAVRAVADAVIDQAAFEDSGPARSLQDRLNGSFEAVPARAKWSGRRTTAVLALIAVSGWALVVGVGWVIARLLG